jgi:hypothetical protein
LIALDAEVLPTGAIIFYAQVSWYRLARMRILNILNGALQLTHPWTSDNIICVRCQGQAGAWNNIIFPVRLGSADGLTKY